VLKTLQQTFGGAGRHRSVRRGRAACGRDFDDEFEPDEDSDWDDIEPDPDELDDWDDLELEPEDDEFSDDEFPDDELSDDEFDPETD
jgi:hypothetical protein